MSWAATYVTAENGSSEVLIKSDKNTEKNLVKIFPYECPKSTVLKAYSYRRLHYG